MALILQQNLRTEGLIRYELKKVYGINSSLAHQICDHMGLSSRAKVGDLNLSQIEKLTRIVTQYYTTGSELQRLTFQDIQRFIQIGSYKGVRLSQGLPVRGQRTHTNARSARRRSSLPF